MKLIKMSLIFLSESNPPFMKSIKKSLVFLDE